MTDKQKDKDKEKGPLSLMQVNLITLLKGKQEALPKDFNQTRFIQNCLVVLQDTKDIEKCDPLNVARTLLKGAFLGLDFFNKECYVIVYNQKQKDETWKPTPNFQTDYKGEKKLAKKYGVPKPKDIYAKLIREGDEFHEEVKDGKQIVNFKPKTLNDGAIIGAFAVAYFEDETMIYEVMTKKEIDHIMNTFSKQKVKQVWIDNPGEMSKKSVLRRLCKHIEKDFDSIEQTKAFEEGSHVEFNNEPKKQVATSSLDNVVDVEAKKVEGENNGKS